MLAFRTVNTNWVESVAAVEAPVIVDWKSTHPLLRYAGFDNVQIVQSLTARAPTWAVSILEAPQAPLILAGELGRQRIVWVGFDPLESNWPLRVSFPIFIANAVDWLNPANAKNSQLLIKAGDPFRMALAEPVKSAEVKLPDGRVASQGAVYVYWFVSENRLSNDHLQRMWWLALDLIRTGELQRWAYMGCLGACVPGQEDAVYQRLEQMIQSLVPQFQTATGPAIGSTAQASRNPTPDLLAALPTVPSTLSDSKER